LEALEEKSHYAETWLLSKASAALDNCGKSFLIEKRPSGSVRYLSSFHCKKKYCPRCASKKRDLLLSKYIEFFKAEKGKQILENFDLAIFTVTLRHDLNGTRPGWYFPELKTHFRNSLKYGAFKKYFAGGFYSTEVTHGKNGFHIHRHSVVLIPKKYNFRDTAPKEGREIIVKDLRAAWLKKTGDSFEIDLTPFNSKVEIVKNCLEVFKYVAKPSQVKTINEKGEEEISLITPPEIVEEFERNNREKFFNRFGILYKEPGLALNKKEENLEEEKPEISDLSNVYIARDLRRSEKTGKFYFLETWKLTASGKEAFERYNQQSEYERKKILLSLTSENFARCYGKENKLSG